MSFNFNNLYWNILHYLHSHKWTFCWNVSMMLGRRRSRQYFRWKKQRQRKQRTSLWFYLSTEHSHLSNEKMNIQNEFHSWTLKNFPPLSQFAVVWSVAEHDEILCTFFSPFVYTLETLWMMNKPRLSKYSQFNWKFLYVILFLMKMINDRHDVKCQVRQANSFHWH